MERETMKMKKVVEEKKENDLDFDEFWAGFGPQPQEIKKKSEVDFKNYEMGDEDDEIETDSTLMSGNNLFSRLSQSVVGNEIIETPQAPSKPAKKNGFTLDHDLSEKEYKIIESRARMSLEQ
jgi:hypothetical protein